MIDEFTEEEKQGFYKTIYSRRDVRSNFTSIPISDETLSKILHAAHHAPSVGFSQPWNFILIKNAKTKKEIKASFDEERRRSSKMVQEPKRAKKYLSLKLEGIIESPVNICVTYDPTKFGPFVIGRTSIPEAGLYSVCCAIQNLWLAARAEGIGVGWVSILSNQTLKDVLKLPEHVIPIAYLCLGQVDSFAQKPDLETAGWLSRLDLKDVIYFERWGSDGNDDNGNDDNNNNWKAIQEIIRDYSRYHNNNNNNNDKA